MLSDKQQNILLKLFEKSIVGNDYNPFSEYKQSASFYKSVGYLKRAGYIYPVKNKLNKTEYKLTLSGEILVRCLANLPDIPRKYRKFSDYL